MYDFEPESGSPEEQSIYDKFLDRLHIRDFIEKLWDALDDMEDDLPKPKEDD